MGLTDKSVTVFLEVLASSAPAPGGGSVAALSGALGASLVSMVCNLTVGRKKYAEVDEDMRTILTQSESLRVELTQLLEDDVAAFNQVSKAMKMSRDTEEQKTARTVALQEALKKALIEHRIAGAGLDVFEKEPLPPEDEMWDLDNVIFTPHISGVSKSGNAPRHFQLFSENLRRFAAGEPLLNVVDKKAGY